MFAQTCQLTRFYNHNELDLRNGFFKEEDVFVWALYKYTIKTQEICLQISALLGERVYMVKKKRYLFGEDMAH